MICKYPTPPPPSSRLPLHFVGFLFSLGWSLFFFWLHWVFIVPHELYLAAVHRLLWLQSSYHSTKAQWCWHESPLAAAHRLRCSVARSILVTQPGLNLCPLNWRADSKPADHQVNLFEVQICGLPWWLSGKESACQCRRHRFDPWPGKILCATEQISPCAATTGPMCCI